MRLIITFLLGLVLSISVVKAQFQKRYTNPANDYLWPIAIDKNPAGYVVGGHTLYPNEWRPYLIRTDNTGNVEWGNMYQISGSSAWCKDAKNVSWTSNHWTVAVGDANGGPPPIGGTDIWMNIVDKAGSVLASWRYGTTDTDLAAAVQAIKHPIHHFGFVLTGNTNNGLNDVDTWVIITNRSGSIVQQAYFDTKGEQRPTAIKMTSDNGFIIVGESSMQDSCDDGDKNIFIMKLDQHLNMQWNRVVDLKVSSVDKSDDVAEAVQQDPNDPDYYYISGTSKITTSEGISYKPFLIRFGNKKIDWVRMYTVEGHTSGRVYDMVTQVTSSGDVENVLSCDFLNSTSPFAKAGLIKTDFAGDVLWSKAYPPGYSESATYAESITLNHIGGFTFTGRIFDAFPPSSGYQTQIAELKIDGESLTDCEEKVEITVTEPKFCISKIEAFVIQPLQQVAYTPNVLPLNLKITTCADDAQAFFLPSEGEKTEMSIAPNPVGDEFYVISKDEVIDLKIYDAYGNSLKMTSYKHGEPVIVIDFERGIYIVEITNSEGVVERHRLFKE